MSGIMQKHKNFEPESYRAGFVYTDSLNIVLDMMRSNQKCISQKNAFCMPPWSS